LNIVHIRHHYKSYRYKHAAVSNVQSTEAVSTPPPVVVQTV